MCDALTHVSGGHTSHQQRLISSLAYLRNVDVKTLTLPEFQFGEMIFFLSSTLVEALSVLFCVERRAKVEKAGTALHIYATGCQNKFLA